LDRHPPDRRGSFDLACRPQILRVAADPRPGRNPLGAANNVIPPHDKIRCPERLVSPRLLWRQSQHAAVSTPDPPASVIRAERPSRSEQTSQAFENLMTHSGSTTSLRSADTRDGATYVLSVITTKRAPCSWRRWSAPQRDDRTLELFLVYDEPVDDHSATSRTSATVHTSMASLRLSVPPPLGRNRPLGLRRP